MMTGEVGGIRIKRRGDNEKAVSVGFDFVYLRVFGS